MISLLRHVKEVVKPRACVICQHRLAPTEHAVCTTCNRHLPRTHYAVEARDNPVCRLFWKQVPIERGASWVVYAAHAPISKAIYALKYRHQATIGQRLGELMATELKAEGFFEGIDFIVPVPLTRGRCWERGYNQSLLIAEGISHVTSIAIDEHILTRLHYKGSQTQQTIERRRENVKGAFQLHHPERVRGHHVLLIDDVITTGATMLSCAKELARAGEVTISVLSLGYAGR